MLSFIHPHPMLISLACCYTNHLILIGKISGVLNLTVFCSNIKEVVEGKPSLLIESVAENIARKVLSNHRMVVGIRVAVRKPHVAIAGMFDSMGESPSGPSLT